MSRREESEVRFIGYFTSIIGTILRMPLWMNESFNSIVSLHFMVINHAVLYLPRPAEQPGHKDPKLEEYRAG
jgi:hypothetical protein